uniref:F-box domain-containing protein n=1 Tax=Meloidogyne enterolobii TaxID=390850 RepID=A0A6V7VT74_MELEN|nr:unnamed protein product [Meloidogyne enterolobii]
MQLQNLPPEILKYIFDFLTFNEKIKIERVCKEWKDLCWKFAWVDFKDLIFDHEDLLLYKNFKNTKELIEESIEALSFKKSKYKLVVFTPPRLDEHKKFLCDNTLDKRRPSRTLGIFNALIRRSAPYLELLCIERGIKVSTRLGRYFHYLTPSLQHFSMEEPIDVWHLNQIEEYLAPNLLSLGLVLNKKKETLDAFLSLILKCQKLECLRINRFEEIFERSLEINQKQFLPSTLQQLFIFDYSVRTLNEISKICPKLWFLLFYNQYNDYADELTDTKIFSLCSPFFFTISKKFLNFHPNLYSLRALAVYDYSPLNNSDLLKIASSCPNLEHLDFCWENYVDGLEGPVDARQLEALYSFKKLSSLSIEIIIISRGCPNESMPFHRLLCDNGNARFDDFIFEFFIKLNSITPLRNLEFRNPLSFYLHSEYSLKLLKNLNSLETFTCTLDRFNELNEFVQENEFFQKLDKILKENGNKLKASFRFLYEYYGRGPDTIFKWRKGYLFEIIRVAKPDPFKDFISGNSIVLKEIMNETFGKRKTQILLRNMGNEVNERYNLEFITK